MMKGLRSKVKVQVAEDLRTDVTLLVGSCWLVAMMKGMREVGRRGEGGEGGGEEEVQHQPRVLGEMSVRMISVGIRLLQLPR